MSVSVDGIELNLDWFRDGDESDPWPDDDRFADISWWMTLYVRWDDDRRCWYYIAADHDAGLDENGNLYTAYDDPSEETFGTWEQATKAAEERYA